MAQGQDYVIENRGKIRIPIFMAIGSADRTVAAEPVKETENKLDSDGLKIYEGSFHCIHEELPETLKEYIYDVKEWIIKQLIIRPVTRVHPC